MRSQRLVSEQKGGERTSQTKRAHRGLPRLVNLPVSSLLRRALRVRFFFGPDRLINLRNLTLARGTRVLAAGIDITLHAGQRIGVVGANGCGKSTLLDLLAGELQAEAGDVELPPEIRIARVLQETPGVPQAALDYVLDGDAELRATERDLAYAQEQHRAGDLAMLHDRLQHIDGYSARSRAAALLHGLGFEADSQLAPVASFSGGWRMRLNLARALIARSDLLLLDEPTNHLDLDAVLWLERWLVSYRGMLLLVSHDRDFLDAIVERVLHFDGRTVVSYTGNYAAFENARAQALANQQSMYARQQRELAHLQSFVDRFRAKATKAKQAQSRLKALARMERIAPAHVDSAFTFRFESPLAAPSPLIALDEAVMGYDPAAPVLGATTFSLLAGSRIGLLGRNGAGKSTLIKALAGEVHLLAGERREGRGLVIGYFAQHQLEQLRSDESPLQHLTRAQPQAREQDVRDFLGRFGFGGEQALAPVGPFSGGERARLALALIVATRPNLLLLDEPTNHLDIEMRHALTLALQEYEGAVVIVSHDRHMLRTTADDFWLVAEGRVQPFDGDLDDYRVWLTAGSRESQQDAAARATRKDERRDRARRQDALAAQRRPLEKESRQLETELERLSAERDGIDQVLIAGAAGASDMIASMHKRRAAIEAAIESSELRWYELQEAIAILDKD
jgi:ATP-binding cassette, subfamily F, member 3